MQKLNSIINRTSSNIYILPFGGCGEFGMNLTSYVYKNLHIVVDCGIQFPASHQLGIDGILPKVDPWFEQLGGVDAYLITHGHEDHIGGLPFIFKKWSAPIYATSWTAQLLEYKSRQEGMERKYPVSIVEPFDKLKIDDVIIHWFPVNHSIPMSCVLLLQYSESNIFHASDFKFLSDSFIPHITEKSLLAEIEDKGVDLLLADSTNADLEGFCPLESSVKSPLSKVIYEAQGIVFFTTFSSNFWRLKSIFEICSQLGKKICIAGFSMEKTIEIAKSTNILEFDHQIIISEDIAHQINRNKLVVLTPGCQAEHRAALSKIVYGQHPVFKLQPKDKVVFSSRTIPGNERPVANLINLICKTGAEVVTTNQNDEIHVSGHAFSQDVESLINILKPKAFLPIHGSYDKLKANLDVALKCGIDAKQAFIPESGDVIELQKEKIRVIEKIKIEKEFVDSFSHQVMSPAQYKERLRIAELGLLIVSGVFSRKKSAWLDGPNFNLFGILDNSWIEKIKQDIIELVSLELKAKPLLLSEDISQIARLHLRSYIVETLRKKPVVVAKIFLV